jgi:hypothetical protein
MKYFWEIGKTNKELHSDRINVKTWKSGLHYLDQNDRLCIDAEEYTDLVQLVNVVNLLHPGNIVRLKHTGYVMLDEIESITIYSDEHPRTLYADANQALLCRFLSKFTIYGVTKKGNYISNLMFDTDFNENCDEPDEDGYYDNCDCDSDGDEDSWYSDGDDCELY